MQTEPNIILYTREECHLCDVAVDMLGQCISDWSEVNIESKLDLIRKYGLRIPVLIRTDNGQELFWPFDIEAIREWLTKTTK